MSRIFGMIISTILVFGLSDIQLKAQGANANATFEINAVMHGGCEVMRSCPFYTLSSRGEISYTQPGIFGGESKQKTGTMNTQDYVALTQSLTAARLKLLESTVFTGTCPSHNDGEDYVFEITRDGQKTRLNTCINALTDDLQINTLVSLFGVFYRELAK